MRTVDREKYVPTSHLLNLKVERPPKFRTHRGRGLLQSLVSKGGNVIDDGGEVSGTVEFDLRETRPVRLHYTFDSCKNTRR